MEKSSIADAYNIDFAEENKLGEGSFGQVYKISRKSDGLECAAKFIKVEVDCMDSNE